MLARIISSISSEIPSLREGVLKFDIYFTLGTRLLEQRFVYCIFQIILLFTLKEVKESLVIIHDVPVETAFTSRTAHNDIIGLYFINKICCQHIMAFKQSAFKLSSNQ